MTLGLGAASAADCKMAAAGSIGPAGAQMATSGVHEEIERQVKRRLDDKKFTEEFAALPNYRISESYDVKTHKDTYYLERKQQVYNGAWGNAPTFSVLWERVYASETKSEVVARFNRVMPKKIARKKAA